MSGIKEKWPAGGGYPLADEDLQRMASVSAAADDLVHEIVFTPPHETAATYSKRVLPLAGESGGAAGLNPRELVVPSSTNGKVAVRPCALLAAFNSVPPATAPALPRIASIEGEGALAGLIPIMVDSPELAAGHPTDARIDLLVATVQRANGPNLARQIKNPTSGQVQTQEVPVYDQPLVSLAWTTGTPGAGAPTYPTEPPGAGATAFRFVLAEVRVPALFDPATTVVSRSNIKPVWPGGWIPSHRIRGGGGASFVAGVGIVASATPIDDRWGSDVRVSLAIRHDAASSCTLDNARNWKNRAVRVTLLRPSAHAGAYPAPHAVTTNDHTTVNRFDTGMQFTGTGGTFWSDAGAPGPSLAVNPVTGALELTFSNGPTDAVNGDHYYVRIEADDRFLAPAGF